MVECFSEPTSVHARICLCSCSSFQRVPADLPCFAGLMCRVVSGGSYCKGSCIVFLMVEACNVRYSRLSASLLSSRLDFCAPWCWPSGKISSERRVSGQQQWSWPRLRNSRSVQRASDLADSGGDTPSVLHFKPGSQNLGRRA